MRREGLLDPGTSPPPPQGSAYPQGLGHQLGQWGTVGAQFSEGLHLAHLYEDPGRQKLHPTFFFFMVLGFEPLYHSTSPFFVMSFFRMGSCELFARAGFKLQSS
jgi:hypothetical protein